MKLPGIPDNVKPSTFNEGQRFIFGCLFSCAGMAFFALVIGLIALQTWGGWPESLYGEIISNLGLIAILSTCIGGMVTAFLAVGGPVGRAKVKAGKDGLDLEASGDGEPVPPVTVTQTTTVAPVQPPYEPGP